ncbi:hypothetical protein [Phocaeicola plebeius]|uniref:hypothetical protein n=1 Tax=Phocaeicola plebeius TaxID=310297 RepID=UPI0026EFC72B|nr:hypothetical protein [Phocaeicola plebeius]MDD6913285.1 hypothetical protein [Phocaeicola plebeius]MDY5978089.1 hypothetical protein [Phocaeicola plebeius]
MREKEIIAMQEEAADKVFYLQKVGMFYQAYNHAAFALRHLMGYKIKQYTRRGKEGVCMAGFPVSLLDSVLEKVKENGGSFSFMDEKKNLVSFMGVDGSEVETVVAEKCCPDVLTLYHSYLEKLSCEDKLKLIVMLAERMKTI